MAQDVKDVVMVPPASRPALTHLIISLQACWQSLPPLAVTSTIFNNTTSNTTSRLHIHYCIKGIWTCLYLTSSSLGDADSPDNPNSDLKALKWKELQANKIPWIFFQELYTFRTETNLLRISNNVNTETFSGQK